MSCWWPCCEPTTGPNDEDYLPVSPSGWQCKNMNVRDNIEDFTTTGGPWSIDDSQGRMVAEADGKAYLETTFSSWVSNEGDNWLRHITILGTVYPPTGYVSGDKIRLGIWLGDIVRFGIQLDTSDYEWAFCDEEGDPIEEISTGGVVPTPTSGITLRITLTGDVASDGDSLLAFPHTYDLALARVVVNSQGQFSAVFPIKAWSDIELGPKGPELKWGFYCYSEDEPTVSGARFDRLCYWHSNDCWSAGRPEPNVITAQEYEFTLEDVTGSIWANNQPIASASIANGYWKVRVSSSPVICVWHTKVQPEASEDYLQARLAYQRLLSDENENSDRWYLGIGGFPSGGVLSAWYSCLQENFNPLGSSTFIKQSYPGSDGWPEEVTVTAVV